MGASIFRPKGFSLIYVWLACRILDSVVPSITMIAVIQYFVTVVHFDGNVSATADTHEIGHVDRRSANTHI
jgi:hypothetical protein